MKNKLWTVGEVRLLQLRYENEGSELLASELKRSQKAIRKRAARLGLRARFDTWSKAVAARTFWTPARDALFRERYPEEGPIPLAQFFGKSQVAIRSHASVLELRSLHRDDRVAETRIRRNPSVNVKYFDVWSPNMAWILGYIWADGNISRTGTKNKRGMSLNFRCSLPDRELIEAIKAEMHSTHMLCFSPPTFRFKSRIQATIGLKICATALCRILIEKYGIPMRKSFHDPEYPQIPDKWAGHFARGFLDGDGYVYEQPSRPGVFYLGFCAAGKCFLEGLQEQVSRLSRASRRRIYIGKTVSRFEWTAKEDLYKLHDFLYPPGEYLFLKRKRMILEAKIAADSDVYQRRSANQSMAAKNRIDRRDVGDVV